MSTPLPLATIDCRCCSASFMTADFHTILERYFANSKQGMEPLQDRLNSSKNSSRRLGHARGALERRQGDSKIHPVQRGRAEGPGLVPAYHLHARHPPSRDKHARHTLPKRTMALLSDRSALLWLVCFAYFDVDNCPAVDGARLDCQSNVSNLAPRVVTFCHVLSMQPKPCQLCPLPLGWHPPE